MPATQHQHHFEDLSPDDFERLIYWLVKRSDEFDQVQSYGGARDKGRDVVAYRHTASGREKWYVQAKRYQNITFAILRDELEKLAEHTRQRPDFAPDAVVFATACPVPPQARDQAQVCAQDLGLPAPYYWDRLTLDEWVSRQPLTELRFFRPSLSEKRVLMALATLAGLVVVVAVALYLLLRPQSSCELNGVLRVAVAGFTEQGGTGESNIGKQLAQEVFAQLEKNLDELAPDLTVSVCPPDLVGSIDGQSAEERATSAIEGAEKVGADVVVYGVVEPIEGGWQITPEFYVGEKSFYEAQEITGFHALGTPFPVSPEIGIADRFRVSREADARVKVLARITMGLALYGDQEYEEAHAYLESAEEVEGWADDEGKEVLYLLLGNAMVQIAAAEIRDAEDGSDPLEPEEAAEATDSLATAEAYYAHSLKLDPEYGRAIIGLAGVYYLRALVPYAETNDQTQTDVDKLDEAIRLYKHALVAAHQPPLADIATKVHFGLGQCYFMQGYAAGVGADLGPAVSEFRSVIEAYGDGENWRLQERAGEAHAGLARIYKECNYVDRAIEEYEAAYSLLVGINQERAALHKQRADDLRKAGNESP